MFGSRIAFFFTLSFSVSFYRQFFFSLQSIRELQNSVRDGVILFNALLEELRKNMDTEKNNINSLAETILENVRKMQDGLLREVDS